MCTHQISTRGRLQVGTECERKEMVSVGGKSGNEGATVAELEKRRQEPGIDQQQRETTAAGAEKPGQGS